MENENYNGHCLRCGETFSSCAQQGCLQINSFELHVKCECQRRGCQHCDPHNKIPLPDFDKLWKEIQVKMESPYFYCLEIKNSAGTYLAKDGSLTRSIYRAERFFGTDGKALANLYLYLCQETGTLKDFIVSEHEFV